MPTTCRSRSGWRTRYGSSRPARRSGEGSHPVFCQRPHPCRHDVAAGLCRRHAAQGVAGEPDMGRRGPPDGAGKAAIPSFVNGHTHAAMTLLRGYADDMPLKEWLETKIWVVEAHLTEEDVYWGTKLACLEMIKAGTTFFNDMYWHWRGRVRGRRERG